MLLKLLHGFAISRNLLEDPAFVKKPVRWIIQLDANGQLLSDGPIETAGEDEKKARGFFIPKTTRPTGGGQVADFLVDDIGALFNLNPKPQAELNQRAINNLRGKYDDFWRQVGEAFTSTGYSAFAALLKFHEQLHGTQPSFLRLDTTGTPKWMIRKASGEEIKLGPHLLTFSVEGNILINDEDVVRPYWRRIHAGETADSESNAQKGTCLITGQVNVPIARTHTPMVERLPKPARSQAGLIGFDKNAFCSYGLKKSLNAPVSIQASKAYLAAIQYLSQQGDHWLSIGPAWLCFWTDKTDAASSYFARLLKRPDSRTVRAFMTAPWSGFEQLPSHLERFIAITFSAAGPRIIVKDWLQITLKEAEENFQRWFKDLEIAAYGNTVESQDERSPLSIDQLACTTIRRREDGRFDRDNLNPDLIAALYRAAIKYDSPPITLLKLILDRFKSSLAKNGLKALYDQSRFSLLKLTLNRNRKEGVPMIEPQVFETHDPAYNCGRLLAVLADAQQKAHDYKLEGAGIAERYFGSACSSPASVFPLLIRLNRHHLNKISKSDRYKGHERFLEEAIQQIIALFKPEERNQPPKFPRVLDLQAQGRFALGFYQQQAADDAARRAARTENMQRQSNS